MSIIQCLIAPPIVLASSTLSSMAWTLFPIVILLSSLTHDAKKIFLLETEIHNSVQDTMDQDKKGQDRKGQDYNMEDMPTRTPPRFTTTAQPDDSCLRTPRSNINTKRTRKRRKKGKIQAQMWGFFMKTGERGRKVCCTRGRKGATVRTLRCCKPKTPRGSC